VPKRSSNASKALSGSPNAKSVTTADPVSTRPASGLDKIAQKEWKRIREAFSASGRLTELDQSLLAMYCSAFSRWKRAEAALLAEGEVIYLEVKDTHGNVTHRKPVVNPHSKIAESAARQVHKFGESLGLSPASRIKQGLELKSEEHRESIFDLLKKAKSSNESTA
jgi:P27 family predicted phage terminase small subunit